MHILKKNLPDYFVALFYTNLKYNSIKLCNKKRGWTKQYIFIKLIDMNIRICGNETVI